MNNLGSTHIHNATYQFSRSLVNWFWRRRFFKVFTIYGHGGHLGHVTHLICIYFHSYSPSSFHMNFGSKSKGDNLNNLGSTHIHNATYQFSRSLVNWFWRRRFFKVFTIYGHGRHVGHVTQLICIYFHSYSPSSFHMNFGFKSPNCF